MAATIRVLICRGPLPPTRSTVRSWMTRSNFAWAAADRSEISSRNKVPPSACSNLPRRPRTPVAVRSSMPNNSASMSVSTSAAQLIATNGPCRRGPSSWIWRATSSLPTPLSPSMSTVKFVFATRSTRSRSSRIASLDPISGAAPSRSAVVSGAGVHASRSVSSSTAAMLAAASISWQVQSSGPLRASNEASSITCRPSSRTGTAKAT